MVSELKDWQKTLLLASLIDEWEVIAWRKFDGDSPVLCYDISDEFNLLMRVFLSDDVIADGYSTLYSPGNMHLAWRMVRWAWDCDVLAASYITPPIPIGGGKWVKFERQLKEMFYLWWMHHAGLISEQAANAQRGWLDKVLELALAAGVVDESRLKLKGD